MRIGTAYLSLGDQAKAREHLDVALRKCESVAAVWVPLAVLEQVAGNHAAVLQYLGGAGQLDNGLAQVYLNKADSYEHRGETEQARRPHQNFVLAESCARSRITWPTVIRHLATLANRD